MIDNDMGLKLCLTLILKNQKQFLKLKNNFLKVFE